eukprot:9498849-Pyramimonas_sp.AAC.1
MSHTSGCQGFFARESERARWFPLGAARSGAALPPRRRPPGQPPDGEGGGGGGDVEGHGDGGD